MPRPGSSPTAASRRSSTVAAGWERYLRLKPKKIDASAAAFAALAYGALQDYDKAVETQRLSVEARPSANGYFQLARLRLPGGRRGGGDRAARGRAPHAARPAQHRARADQGHEEAGRCGSRRRSRRRKKAERERPAKGASPARASARCPGGATGRRRPPEGLHALRAPAGAATMPVRGR